MTGKRHMINIYEVIAEQLRTMGFECHTDDDDETTVFIKDAPKNVNYYLVEEDGTIALWVDNSFYDEAFNHEEAYYDGDEFIADGFDMADPQFFEKITKAIKERSAKPTQF